ncbi:MAG TPA: DinB family protein [Cyclobacteriaceae bacterium]
MENAVANEVIRESVHRMEENTSKIRKCLEALTDEDVWQRPNDASNSVGNQLLHLCGNITQYILSALGREPDNRQRDLEFSADGGMTKNELLARLELTVSKAVTVIKNIKEDELLPPRSVQGFSYSAIGIIIHVVEHYSYHTGQIIFWTKLLKNRDMGFYAGADLNRRNEP